MIDVSENKAVKAAKRKLADVRASVVDEAALIEQREKHVAELANKAQDLQIAAFSQEATESQVKAARERAKRAKAELDELKERYRLRKKAESRLAIQLKDVRAEAIQAETQARLSTLKKKAEIFLGDLIKTHNAAVDIIEAPGFEILPSQKQDEFFEVIKITTPLIDKLN